jgi:type II secretory pathway pseudopilin PulG
MIALLAKERFLREERGFSLPEMMTTILIMIVVFFALHSIFDMSIKVFSYGNSKAEAMENARAELEKMEREIRQADGDALIFETWDESAIRFGNDLDGNGVIQCPNTDPDPQCEKIGYEVYEIPPADPADNPTYALGRDNSSTGTTNTAANLQPVSEYVDYVSPTNTGLSFDYLGNDCAPEGCGAEDQIERVRIELRISVENVAPQDATQTLTTDVALRNRGG